MKRDTQIQKRDTLLQNNELIEEKNRDSKNGDPGRIRTCNLPLRRDAFIALFLL